jgi:sugar (pentulose or hexulose) kinase
MSGNLSLGIDIGTTNVKACILDTEKNQVVASGCSISRTPELTFHVLRDTYRIFSFFHL